MKKKLFSITLLLAIAIGYYIYFYSPNAPQHDSSLTLYGNVDTRQVNLAFRVSGRILQINVDEGDTVHAGDVIATLDSEPYQIQLDSCKANLAAAEANLLKLKNGYRPEEIKRTKALKKFTEARLKNSAIQHDRSVTLFEQVVVPENIVDQTLSQRDSDAASVEMADAELEMQENGYRTEDIAVAAAQADAAKAAVAAQELALKDCSLIAPEDGIVQIRSKEPGAMVSAGTGIITETLNSPVWVRTYISETNLGKIKVGEKVAIYMDSNPKEPSAYGKIGFISPVAEFTPKSVETATLRTDLVYRIRIVVEEGAERLLQGMPVTIKVQTLGK